MVLEVADFQSEVLEASHSRPVVVDFWAPWCGPCRMLGPVLEKLAESSEDAWTLAKVNTDENPQVSRKYGIMSIPAVKLFVAGEVVDEFVGALPESAVRQWLEKALPSERRIKLAEARTAVEAGNPEEAAEILGQILGEEPANAEARLLLARVRVFSDPVSALALTGDTETATASEVHVRQAILTLAHLATVLSHREALPAAPALEIYIEAIEALSRQDLDAALAGLIDVVRKNRDLDEDGARRGCLALFTLLGEQHELTRKYRRSLQMALF